MSRSAYGKQECWICGKIISVAGFAQYNHKMMHVRRGEMRNRFYESSRPPYYQYNEFKITEAGHEYRKQKLRSKTGAKS